MNELIKANKKYVVLIVAGVLLLVLPNFLGGKVGGDTSCEQQFKRVMEAAEGIGNVEIMTNKGKDGTICGVVVVASGAGSSGIKKQISDAACAAFGVEPHKVQVFSYKQEVKK